MEVLLGICLVQTRFGEDNAHGQRLAAFLARLGCHVLELDTSADAPLATFSSASFAPQVIHGFHLVKSGIFCHELARQGRVPLVITCTGTDVFIDLQTPGLNETIRNVLSAADKVVVPFYGMLPYLREFLPEEGRFTIIPKGVQPPTPSDLPDLQTHPVPAHGRIVLLPGAILPARHTHFAIHALNPLLSRFPDLHLVILGNVLDSQYGQMVTDLAGNHPWVRILPALSPGEMARWYQRADVVLNVSHVEGGSQFMLEAMSLGAPVLASDIPGNRAYITDEASNEGRGTGFLYSTSPSPEGFQRIHEQADLVDKMTFLLEHHEIRTQTGKRAAAWVKETLNPDLEAFLYLELYRKLTEKG
ncbi:MAG: glycosyltransferase family 4 protein [Candidatus Riflebacteria bacterium]|nr:glycosyltransferase family 4 protein [Candidatus Riflebacteria bacterium]